MTKKKGFDLSSLTELDEAEMTVVDPRTGVAVMANDGKPWTIRFAGPGHEATVELRNNQMRKAVERARKQAAGDDLDAAMDTIEEQTINAYAKRTLGWGPIDYEGQPFPFSTENAQKLYAGSRTLLKQIDAFMQEEANFLPDS